MTQDLLLCQTRSSCSECRWSGPRGCALLDGIAAALPPRPSPPPSTPFAWSEAGLSFDGRLTA